MERFTNEIDLTMEYLEKYYKEDQVIYGKV
jgi:hypothetical protein